MHSDNLTGSLNWSIEVIYWSKWH